MPEKRRGLGRGLGALIPSSVEQEESASNGRSSEASRPVDLFFPSGASRREKDGQPAEGREDSKSETLRKSAINKDALTAPSKRASDRSQSAARKNASPAAGGSAKGGRSRGASTPDTKDTVDVAGIAESSDQVVPPEEETATGSTESDVSRETLRDVPGARFAEVPVGSIHANRKQPRTVFDEDEMAELVHSVREIGVLQPIVVRVSQEGSEQQYELVMGERRWRATKEAGLATVPAIIRDTTDDDLLRDALLENLHRSQLNPLEEAAAYQQLLDDFGCTQEELAARIGRSRPQISNTLRLMKLPPLVQRRLAAGVLSAGHARALLGLADQAEMEKLAQRIVAEGLSVRSTEEIVAMSDGLRRPSKPAAPRAGARHERLDYLATSLSDRLDTNVKITLGAKKGRVSIEFASVDDLNRIMGVLTPTQ